MHKITACIICKNEERHIAACLNALKKYEIPVVLTDTGSTDRTVSLAESILTDEDRICHYAWQNDFAAARNFCAEAAQTDWIWAIDADEVVTHYGRGEMENFLRACCHSAVIGTVSQKDVFEDSEVSPMQAVTQLGRVYHKKFCRYEGAVHEQIRPLPPYAESCTYKSVAIKIDHYGYANPDDLRQKCLRNMALLKRELSQLPDSDTEQAPYLYYQLGKSASILKDYPSAISYFEKGLSYDLDPRLSYVASMVESYGYALLDTKQFSAALSFTEIYDAFCYRADFVFLMGLIYMNNARFDRAISEFQKAAAFPASEIIGVNGDLSYYNIGVIYECMNQKKEAAKYYNMCRGYAPAQERLAALGAPG